MSAKSPTGSIKSREMIGGEQFSMRREVFGKHDTVFVPLPSPPAVYKEAEPIITSNHGKTTTNFKRNAPIFSSMRESRNDDRESIEFRTRKYSDNFTSEIHQDDYFDYRKSMTERTRRLSKLRREFLNSNLHEPSSSPFSRTGVRSTMPARTGPVDYKIESPNLYKFPFAEPYTPTPTRRSQHFSLLQNGESDIKDKENQDPDSTNQNISLKENGETIDHQKLFEELLKKYSPQRKSVDWKIPPTGPRIVGTLPKRNAIDEVAKTRRATSADINTNGYDLRNKQLSNVKTTLENEENTNSQISLTELAERNDEVPELTIIQRQISRDPANKRPVIDKSTDLSIPALIEKMNAEGQDLEKHKNEKKKVKRKRSFIDKLLGRNKESVSNKK